MFQHRDNNNTKYFIYLFYKIIYNQLKNHKTNLKVISIQKQYTRKHMHTYIKDKLLRITRTEILLQCRCFLVLQNIQ